MKRYTIMLAVLAIFLSGCSSIGPARRHSTHRDSVKFTMPNRAIEDIHEQQNHLASPQKVQKTVNNTGNIPKQKSNSEYRVVSYTPLTQAKCLEQKEKLGLQFCPYDNDHLAGVALACGHLSNIPSGKNLHKLAQKVYNIHTDETSIYGTRNDALLKEMGIYARDSHLFYWVGEEAKDGVNGFVRMFAAKGSIPYYAPRDGSGYVSKRLGSINYGETKYIRTKKEHDSNIVGLPNEDVLFAICYNK